MEITFKNKTYKMKAGMGFLREITKTTIQETNGVQVALGLETAAVQMIELQDVPTLAMVLDLLNKHAGGPRLTSRDIDEFLEDEDTDLDALFAEVIDFLSKANVCKAKMKTVLKETVKVKA